LHDNHQEPFEKITILTLKMNSAAEVVPNSCCGADGADGADLLLLQCWCAAGKAVS
jgi:hypothetical protein